LFPPAQAGGKGRTRRTSAQWTLPSGGKKKQARKRQKEKKKKKKDQVPPHSGNRRGPVRSCKARKGTMQGLEMYVEGKEKKKGPRP